MAETNWGLLQIPDIGGAFRQGQEARRQSDARNALAAYATNPNEQSLNALAPIAPEFVIQQRQSLAKTRQEQETLQQKQQQEQIGIIGRLLSSVRDEQTYQQALAAARQGGIDVSNVPQTFDPNWVNQTKMLVDAYSADGGQQLSGLARELLNAGYQQGTPEFQQAMMVALQGKYAPQYTDQQGNLRQARLPSLPQPGQPAQPAQPVKETSFEAASDIARQMGPQFPEFVRNNGFRVRVASPEQAMQLPSGTPLILPDGSEGVVP